MDITMLINIKSNCSGNEIPKNWWLKIVIIVEKGIDSEPIEIPKKIAIIQNKK
jgi:hypothetical protein